MSHGIAESDANHILEMLRQIFPGMFEEVRAPVSSSVLHNIFKDGRSCIVHCEVGLCGSDRSSFLSAAHMSVKDIARKRTKFDGGYEMPVVVLLLGVGLGKVWEKPAVQRTVEAEGRDRGVHGHLCAANRALAKLGEGAAATYGGQIVSAMSSSMSSSASVDSAKASVVLEAIAVLLGTTVGRARSGPEAGPEAAPERPAATHHGAFAVGRDTWRKDSAQPSAI